MPTVFLSYAREDLEQAGRIAEQLAAEGVTVWRDQERLCVGQAWPKALGEAIAASDAVLLLWSSRSAGSSFAELEWCTALALKKPILPCLLDQTPLPPSLAAIEAAEPAGIAAAVGRSLAAHARDTKSSDRSHTQKVVGRLAEIGPGTPAEVLSKAKAVFAQSNWMVQGPVYQAGGDIHIGAPPGPKSKLEKWRACVAILVGILTAAGLVRGFLPAHNKQGTPASQSAVTRTQTLAGTVSDDAGEPLANVRLSVLLGGNVVKSDVTGSVGQYSFQIDGPPEADVSLMGQKDGYHTEKRYTHLGNSGFNFKMRRN
jgi:hypothetical protein